MLADLATLFLAAKFYAHRAHNLASGPTFFADHDYLGSLYEAYESAYDTLIERMVGLGEEPQIITITRNATASFERLARAETKTDAFFAKLLQLENGLRTEIADLMAKTPSDGVQNLLQGMADESEARTYKLKQRSA